MSNGVNELITEIDKDMIKRLIFDWDATLTLWEGLPIWQPEYLSKYIQNITPEDNLENRLKKYISMIETETMISNFGDENKILKFMYLLFGEDRFLLLRRLFQLCDSKIPIIVLTNSGIYITLLQLYKNYDLEYKSRFELKNSLFHDILRYVADLENLNVRVITGYRYTEFPATGTPDKTTKIKRILLEDKD